MSEQNRSTVRTQVGRVVSNKMLKTIVVVIEKKVPHEKYGKFVSSRTKYFAHDEDGVCHIGDLVEIKASRPISKKKCWVLVKVLEKALQSTNTAGEK